MRAVDTGDRRRRPGGGRLMPIMRDWLVETIPDQVADIREVIDAWQPSAIATDLSLWGPVVVLPDLGRAAGRAVVDVHGAADPGSRCAGVRVRAAPAARAGGAVARAG